MSKQKASRLPHLASSRVSYPKKPSSATQKTFIDAYPTLNQSLKESKQVNDKIDDDHQNINFLTGLFEDLPVNMMKDILIECSNDMEVAVERLLKFVEEQDETLIPETEPTGLIKSNSINKDIHNTEMELVLFQSFCQSTDSPFDFLKNYFKHTNAATIQNVLILNSYDVLESIKQLSIRPISPIQTPTLFEQLLALKEILPNESELTILDSLQKFEFDSLKVVDSFMKENLGPLDKMVGLFPENSRESLVSALQNTNSLDEAIENILSSDYPSLPNKLSSLDRNTNETPKKIVLSGTFRTSNNNPGMKHELPKLVESLMDKGTTTNDAMFYRQKATIISQERHQLFSNAVRSFKQGGLTGRGAAAYYSQEVIVILELEWGRIDIFKGQKLKSAMRECNREAAKAIIHDNSLRFSDEPNVIDLHGLTISEAVEYTEEYVTRWFSSKKYNIKALRVITGAGQHSVGGTAKLYPAVFGHLKRQGWRVEPGGSGWFVVRGT